MQIMYVLAFMVTLMVVMVTQGKDAATVEQTDSRAVAAHMAAWHRAAVETCLSGCPGGLVDPRGKLSPQLAGGPAFVAGRFVSRYDNVNRRIVTYMPSASREKGTVSFGSVSSALQDLWLQEGESSHVGIWRSATRALHYSVPPANSPPTLQLPSPFMGGNIPDRSPVLVSGAW